MAPLGSHKGNKRQPPTKNSTTASPSGNVKGGGAPALKSCLKKYNHETHTTTGKKFKSKVNSFLANSSKGEDNNNPRGKESKKRVSFAPGTCMVDRESKPYNRMTPKPRPPPMPDLFSGFTFSTSPTSSGRPYISSFNNNNNSNNINNSHQSYNSSKSAPPQGSSSFKVTNEYTKFTLAKKAPEHALHTEMDRLPARVKRLFENIENLQVAHVAYNSLPSTEHREKFLLDQVIRRQIVSLEISMSEGLIHFAMDVIDTMYEATQFIRTLFHEDFYNPDGSHTLLPIILNNESDDYINKLAPVVYSLNRISGERRRSDNSAMSIETVCTKLQLEMISLTICPVKSLMFRSILEVVPSTAMRARQLLEELEHKSNIKWVNNSPMRKDYTRILLNFKLIDRHDIVTKFPILQKNTTTTTTTNKGQGKKVDPGLGAAQQAKKNLKTTPSSNPCEMGDVSHVQ